MINRLLKSILQLGIAATSIAVVFASLALDATFTIPLTPQVVTGQGGVALASQDTLSGIKAQTDQFSFSGGRLQVDASAFTISNVTLGGVLSTSAVTVTPISSVGLVSVQVNNFPAVQAVSQVATVPVSAVTTTPISAESLPLPAGASTEETISSVASILSLIKAKTDNLDVLLSTRTKPSDTQYVGIADGHWNDAFGRIRISSPANVFDAQFTYGLQPLIFEQITSGVGATVSWDSTNRNALMTFASSPAGSKAAMQTYQFYRYQPMKSQKITITENFNVAASAVKFAGYSDGTNGIEFQNNGGTNQWVVLSSSGNGNITVTQANWNVDCLCDPASNPGAINPSGYRLDITKNQQVVIDLEALYVGRVRVGFDLGGKIVYTHYFNFANTTVYPYLATANLPIRVGMTATGTVSTTMVFQCSAIVSEGGSETVIGYEHEQEVSGVAIGNGAMTHVMSIRPKTTFNGVTNRATVHFIEINGLVTGNNPVYWELCIGQALTGTTTFSDVSTTYSAIEYNTAGTLSGACAIPIDSGFIAASNQSKGVDTMTLTFRYPITLNADGQQRSLGTLTLEAYGLGGATTLNASMKWTEIQRMIERASRVAIRKDYCTNNFRCAANADYYTETGTY